MTCPTDRQQRYRALFMSSPSQSKRQVRDDHTRLASTTGRSFPLGATLVSGGANFSVFSRTARNIEVLFVDREDDARLSRIIPIDPLTNRTYHYWHVFVPGVEAGQIQTQPACLAYATREANSDAPNSTYAAVYPVTLIAKIILAQLLI